MKSREWYDRGILPHRTRDGLIQLITYRQADSLPQHVLTEFQQQILHLPEEEQAFRRRVFMQDFLDRGAGSCLLRHPLHARLIIENWQYWNQVKYDLLAYVVMPNHVHVLIRQNPEYELSQIIFSWKRHTGTSISGQSGFWQKEFWDTYIRNRAHLNKALNYIFMNPVKAGLRNTPDSWPFSSAGDGWAQKAMPAMFLDLP